VSSRAVRRSQGSYLYEPKCAKVACAQPITASGDTADILTMLQSVNCFPMLLKLNAVLMNT
jgi:hypothetical protein